MHIAALCLWLLRAAAGTVPTAVGGKGKKEVSGEVASLVGTNLARLREAKGLSQEEVAYRAGLHRTEISLMELGKRTIRIDTFFRLVGALEIEPGEGFDGARWVPFRDKPDGQIRHDDRRAQS